MPRPVARPGRHHEIRLAAWMLAVLTLCAFAGCSNSDGSSSPSPTQPNEAATDASTPAETDESTDSSTAANSNDEGAVNQPEPSKSAEQLEEELTAAATRLWEARLKEDWSIIFEYQQFRSTEEEITVEKFTQWSQQNEPFVIHDYEIQEISVDGDLGWVTLDYTSTIRQFPNAAPQETSRDEIWQRVDGMWKLVPSPEYELYPAPPHKRDAAAEAELRKRFDESWQARVDEDWAALYAMSDPRDHDEIAEHELAEAKAITIYLERDIEWIEVIGDRGTVRVAITHKINDPNLTKLPARVVTKDEAWVRLDGIWYMDLRPESAQ